ncbi:glycoside hydrolase family 3 protein [Paludibacterium paludis]|uniref:glycoside hydrolase family 3 protein n=2 Tax=Paludibacterium paludis TaxID=1225769 RepID=UPI00227D8302|nr:glycoside hydrolase family 3 protein [Paludibacterium paludis]
MSTREKVGQKIMMAFRYWCSGERPDCTEGMTELPDAALSALRANHIGGVILFANNLTGIDQTRRLTERIKSAAQGSPVQLLVGVDQEGGNVFRLPRTLSTPFSGNMALGAAFEGTKRDQLAFDQGRVLAAEMAAAGFNVNFAPVVDVNSNPLNPVINVRAFGDDAATVGRLGNSMAEGMKSEGMIATFKHYPGHGDTETDSHYGLPVVKKTRREAYAVDLAPYRDAIAAGRAPEMIMTAHIQYPALDNSLIRTRTGEQMIPPATMSRVIQHDILRGEFGFGGVTVSDALDMKGIADFFEPDDAVIKVFQADVDIALMPVEFRTASGAKRLSVLVDRAAAAVDAGLIDRAAAAVDAGLIDRAALDRSVRRIVAMKLRHGMGHPKPLPSASVIGSPDHRELEKHIAHLSVTALLNRNGVLPLKAEGKRIFIMTPWGEQAEAMRRRFDEHGYRSVKMGKLASMTWSDQKRAIDEADIVVLGTLSTGMSPVERNGDPDAGISRVTAFAGLERQPFTSSGSLVFNVEEDAPSSVLAMRAAGPWEMQRMRYAMEYAKNQNKVIVHVSMRSPYDVVNFDDISDATLATYAYYGYENGWRGQSLPAAVDAMLGYSPLSGKLPVAIYELRPDGSPGALRYSRGFGLRY